MQWAWSANVGQKVLAKPREQTLQSPSQLYLQMRMPRFGLVKELTQDYTHDKWWRQNAMQSLDYCGAVMRSSGMATQHIKTIYLFITQYILQLVQRADQVREPPIGVTWNSGRFSVLLSSPWDVEASSKQSESTSFWPENVFYLYVCVWPCWMVYKSCSLNTVCALQELSNK